MGRTPESLFNVVDYGVVADGKTKNTAAIADAISACSGAGGGTVYFPPGEYLTGPICLKSNLTLRLEAGATIRFVQNFEDYPTVQSRWGGREQHGFCPLVYGVDLENVALTGRGVLDGQGDYWWKLAGRDPAAYPEALRQRHAEFARLNKEVFGIDTHRFGRPPLVHLRNCRNVLLEGLTHRNSPFWNTHLVYCRNVTVEDIKLENPPGAPNGDGLDIDSCQFVRVSNIYADVNDDAICIKAGMNEDGRRVGIRSENITITNCTIQRGHGGVVIGSDTSGGVRNVAVSNCVFMNTDRGVRIKSARGRGGVVEDCRFTNIIMKHVVCPFVINKYYGTDVYGPAEPVSVETPIFRNIHFDNITARDVRSAGFFAGLPELPFEGISLSNIAIEATRELFKDRDSVSKGQYANEIPAMARNYEPIRGFFCRNVNDVQFTNVRVETREGPAMVFENVGNLDIQGFGAVAPHAGTPVITMEDTNGAYVSGCTCPEGTDTFLQIKGQQTRDISIGSNRLSAAKQAIEVSDDVPSEAVSGA